MQLSLILSQFGIILLLSYFTLGLYSSMCLCNNISFEAAYESPSTVGYSLVTDQVYRSIQVNFGWRET